VKQAGIFSMQGFGEAELAPMLGAFCPGTLYPYAREAVSDLVARGGFPQLVLAPINFDALYAQQAQEIQAQVADPGNQGGSTH
jgi:preprotein translocase subunit SecB